MLNKDASPIVIDRTLHAETTEQRAAESKIGAADIAECRARMAVLTAPGVVYHPEDGERHVVSAALTRALVFAQKG